jgi:hypothetical protein
MKMRCKDKTHMYTKHTTKGYHLPVTTNQYQRSIKRIDVKLKARLKVKLEHRTQHSRH